MTAEPSERLCKVVGFQAISGFDKKVRAFGV